MASTQVTDHPFWAQDAEYWFRELKSSPEGLHVATASTILKNQSAAKSMSSPEKDLLLFFRQFKSPLVLMLLAAVILSAFLGDLPDVFIMMGILVATGLISFF